MLGDGSKRHVTAPANAIDDFVIPELPRVWPFGSFLLPKTSELITRSIEQGFLTFSSSASGTLKISQSSASRPVPRRENAKGRRRCVPVRDRCAPVSAESWGGSGEAW